MDANLEQLLSDFNRNNVKYIESSHENAVATYKVLAEFGVPLAGFALDDFSDGRTVSRFGNPPICLELIQRIDGIDFATAYANSEIVMTDGDLPVRYISPDDLISTKLAAGRQRGPRRRNRCTSGTAR